MMPFAFVLLRAERILMLMIFNFRIRSFEFGFWVVLLLSSALQIFGSQDMEGLIMGGFDDPHLDKLIMLSYWGLNEGIE